MAKYIVLYMVPVGAMDEMMKNATQEQKAASMAAGMKWGEAHKGEITDMGMPLGKNQRATTAGGEDVRNELGGYSFVEADSHEAAAAVFADSPHLQMPGAYIEVVECVV